MKLLREIVGKSLPYEFLNHEKDNFDRDYHQDLHESLKKHYKNIDPENHPSLREYQDGSSFTFNRNLWNVHNGVKSDISKITKIYAPSMQKELLSHKTPHDLHVWSGTPVDPRQIKDKNNIVHHPAFLSTSLREGIGNRFANRRATYRSIGDRGKTVARNHIMKIHIPEGHPGYYMGNHDSEGFGKVEKEFILPAGTNLKHVKTETFMKKNKDDYRTDIYNVHHMEVMPHKHKEFPIKNDLAKPTDKDGNEI